MGESGLYAFTQSFPLDGPVTWRSWVHRRSSSAIGWPGGADWKRTPRLGRRTERPVRLQGIDGSRSAPDTRDCQRCVPFTWRKRPRTGVRLRNGTAAHGLDSGS